MALKKKYINLAKGDFKKAWRLQKASKKTRRASTRRVTTKTKRRVATLARKTKRRSSRGMSDTTKLLIGIAGYGLVREPLNQAAKKIPFTAGLADEIVLLGISGVAAWKGTGIVKKAGIAGLAFEGVNLVRAGTRAGLSNLFKPAATAVAVTDATNGMVVIG